MAIQSKGVLIIMPSLFTEDTYEQAIIELFENMGYPNFEKRKGLTTNQATRPFWVVAGGGMDVKEKFSKSEVYSSFNSISSVSKDFDRAQKPIVKAF